MLKAVIFDFDGVIADSELCHLAAFNEVLAKYGVSLSKEKYYADYLGLTDIELLEAVDADFGGETAEDIARLKTDIFERIVTRCGGLLDGIPEFVKKLTDAGIAIAINSGAIAADIKVMLAGTAIENCFPVIVSANDVEKGKPAPDGYLLAAERLSKKLNKEILPADCIAIEDSRWGIASAKAAGMKVAAVTNSYPADKLTDADLIVDSARELTIEKLQMLCR